MPTPQVTDEFGDLSSNNRRRLQQEEHRPCPPHTEEQCIESWCNEGSCDTREVPNGIPCINENHLYSYGSRCVDGVCEYSSECILEELECDEFRDLLKQTLSKYQGEVTIGDLSVKEFKQLMKEYFSGSHEDEDRYIADLTVFELAQLFGQQSDVVITQNFDGEEYPDGSHTPEEHHDDNDAALESLLEQRTERLINQFQEWIQEDKECEDLDGWLDVDGDGCDLYLWFNDGDHHCDAGQLYINRKVSDDHESFRRWKDAHGISAVEACCACGRRSYPTDDGAVEPAVPSY